MIPSRRISILVKKNLLVVSRPLLGSASCALLFSWTVVEWVVDQSVSDGSQGSRVFLARILFQSLLSIISGDSLFELLLAFN